MAEKPRSLLESAPDDPLSAGVARFEKLIETVKVQQAQSTPQAPAAPANPLLYTSPGEEWSRQFQSQSIGPELKGLTMSDLAPFRPAMVTPPAAPDIVPTRTADIAPPSAARALGAQIGRPEKPRRSWLGRMFQRS